MGQRHRTLSPPRARPPCRAPAEGGAGSLQGRWRCGGCRLGGRWPFSRLSLPWVVYRNGATCFRSMVFSGSWLWGPPATLCLLTVPCPRVCVSQPCPERPWHVVTHVLPRSECPPVLTPCAGRCPQRPGPWSVPSSRVVLCGEWGQERRKPGRGGSGRQMLVPPFRIAVRALKLSLSPPSLLLCVLSGRA